MNLNKALKWRYATKKFDSSKKITQEDLAYLKESIQLAATSFGLQLMKIKIINDPAIRAQLKDASWNQTQVVDASHLIVLCNDKSYDVNRIDEFVSTKAEIQNLDIEKIKGYGDFMKKTLEGKNDEDFNTWTAKQCYIALGNLLAACGELKIDSCPMEGFEIDKYNEILDLDKENLNACLVIPVGYRSEEDNNAKAKKVRRFEKDLFAEI